MRAQAEPPSPRLAASPLHLLRDLSTSQVLTRSSLESGLYLRLCFRRQQTLELLNMLFNVTQTLEDVTHSLRFLTPTEASAQ